MMITHAVWNNVTGLEHNGFKVGKGNTIEISEFNKMQFYCSCLKDQNTPFNRFHVGNLKLTPRFLAYIIAWQLTPRKSNHAMLIEEDLILIYCLMNKIKVNWIYVMKEHKIKSKRLVDYKFPFAVVVSKFLEYVEVDVKDDLIENIKSGSEIDCSTLVKMGFSKS